MSNQNNKKEFENMVRPYVTTDDAALIMSQFNKTIILWKGGAEIALYHDGAYHRTYGANATALDVFMEIERLEQRKAAAGARQVC